MNVFGTGLRAGSSLAEPLVASLQPEAVDVSPAVGLDEQGYLGQHHELHRAGELELRRPGWRPLQVGPPSTLGIPSTTSARLAKKALVSRIPRKLPQVAANFEGSGSEVLEAAGDGSRPKFMPDGRRENSKK